MLFSPSFHLTLMPLNLGPLVPFPFPLLSEFLPLSFRPRLIVVDAPSRPSFPVPILVPPSPVLFQTGVGNSLIVPSMPVPVMISVEVSPIGVYIEIESRDTSNPPQSRS